jgi:hypothetical protein
MGYHIILKVECELKPIYTDVVHLLRSETEEITYVEDNEYESYLTRADMPQLTLSTENVIGADKNYLVCYDGSIYRSDVRRTDLVDEYGNITIVAPESFPELKVRWDSYGFVHFYKFDIKNGVWTLRIEEKPYRHIGDLEDDYRKFIAEVLPILSSYVHKCSIKHDDYGLGATIYTNDEIHRIRYIYARKKPEVPAVQYGRRKPTIGNKSRVSVELSKWAVHPDIYDSEPETWPPELRHWWICLKSGRVEGVIKNLRECYGEDEYLTKTADWLSTWAQNLDVEFEYV